MRIIISVSIIAIAIVSLSTLACAENWIDFHTEKWSRKSGKLGEKLLFKNRYYYDAESIVRTSSGDITLWIKEIFENDKYYVKKGAPQCETVFKKIHLWCRLKRYEVIQEDTEAGAANELVSEEIKTGSYYEMLYKAVCNLNAQ